MYDIVKELKNSLCQHSPCNTYHTDENDISDAEKNADSATSTTIAT